MNNIQLYINDNLVDISDDSPVALTFQINNLAEVQNQQGHTSNQFKLPLTQRNRQILGFPDDINFCTTQPYQQYSAKFIQDGLEIIPFGIAELNGIDQNTANMTILSGNVDFFDAIDGKLYDMGDSTSQWSNYGKSLVWQPYDHQWNIQNVAGSQNKTEGWIWPVVDYGGISTADYTSPIDVRLQRPGFFIKTAIDLLLKSAGYKGKGSLLQNPLYPLLICQFSSDSFDHGTDYQNNAGYKSITVQNGLQFSVSHPNTLNNIGPIPFSLIIADPNHVYAIQSSAYIASEITSITASFAYSISFTSSNQSHAGYSSKIAIQLRLYNGAADQVGLVLTEQIIDYADRGSLSTISLTNQVVSFDTVLAAGQSVKVTYEFRGSTGSSFSIKAGATFTVTNKVQGVQYGQVLQCERIFPDIAQKDLLKDILQHFGILCQTDNADRTVSFNSFRDIIDNIPVAKDWSMKCLNQGKSIAYQLGNYAQVNYLRYKQDDNVLPYYFADDKISISDATLQATADLFTGQFAPTLNRPYSNGSIAQILKIDPKSGTTDFSISTQPRLLVDQKINLLNSGRSVTFTEGNTATNVVVNDVISVPYFYKPDGEYNLCYGDLPDAFGKPVPGLKTLYYHELQKILTQTKKVIRYFLLSPRDILELDLLVPIYLQQDNAYYYINKIDAWRKNQPTKVELVKLG